MEEDRICGKCVICGVIGHGEKNFICENCGDPNGIIYTCQACGRHIDFIRLDKKDMARLSAVLGHAITLGTAMAGCGCPVCGWGDELKLEIYKLR